MLQEHLCVGLAFPRGKILVTLFYLLFTIQPHFDNIIIPPEGAFGERLLLLQ